MTPDDRLELHELPGRYGDAIDDRDWPGLDRIFTEDAVFDLTGVGSRRLVGLEEIRSFMDVEANHPKTHLMTNIYADETERGVEMHFRIVAMRSGGLMGTASYHDLVVRTDAGWRVQDRSVVLRRTPVT